MHQDDSGPPVRGVGAVPDGWNGGLSQAPGIVAAAIFTFIISWNEVFAASILTLQNRTLPAHVLAVLDQSPLPFRFAGGFFLLAPSLIVIFVIRRYLFNMWGRVVR